MSLSFESSYLIHLKFLLKKLGIAFLLFTLCRIIFLVFNYSHFNQVSFGLLFYGVRFDIVAIAYLFSPLALFELLPVSFRSFNWYKKLLGFIFYLPLSIGIALNLIDVAYFDFTLKRTTADFFSMISAGDDFFTLLPNYIIDFWYAYVLLAALIMIAIFLHKKCCKNAIKFSPYTFKHYLYHSTILIVFCGVLIIGMRGGLQYKPIDIVNAGQYTTAQNTPIILNTPFTIFKTIFVETLEPINYFDEEKVNYIYQPIQHIYPKNPLGKKNVVFIILESFAKEYVGYLNNGKGYTPFLDSLMNESYTYTNAFANGQRSIESLPAIFAGLPQLMSTPYSVSGYAGNKLDALPNILKANGYNTSFYHGGANGTMGFNGFVGTIGVDNYFGMDEYPNKEKDYDNKWGIFDEPYLQYFAHELSQKQEPFFSSVFTLSSHHPYQIPKEHTNQFPKGNLPIHETIGYTDYSLKQFFKSAQTKSWFNNTIFVFTADHSTHSETAYYKTSLNRFAIPIFIYAPNTNFKGVNNSYFQQIDIMPTIIDLLGIKKEISCFGINGFNNRERFVVNYISGNYQFAAEDYFLIFNGTSSTGFYDLRNDSLIANNLINQLSKEELNIKNGMEKKLKAIIQQYNNRMINNHLSLSNS